MFLNKFYKAGFVPAVISCLLISDALASTSGRASSHAPIGVMGDHMHNQGEWMLSYRYMRMDMDGNRIGTNRVSAPEIVGTGQNPGQFLVAPTRMPMNMHMLGGMYGVSDNVTLMAMVNFYDNSMDHLIRNGVRFTTESSGLGDTTIAGMLRLSQKEHSSAHATLGLSLPTGDIDVRDDTPAMTNALLPYPMQLGFGTYDLLPAITWAGHNGRWSYGSQASAVIRLGTNDNGYSLGDKYKLSLWSGWDFSDSLSGSARLEYQNISRIDGANPVLNPLMIQTANTDLQGGNRIDFSLGANYLLASGHRLAIEYAVPVNQDLNGPQLETDNLLTIGWQKAF